MLSLSLVYCNIHGKWFPVTGGFSPLGCSGTNAGPPSFSFLLRARGAGLSRQCRPAPPGLDKIKGAGYLPGATLIDSVPCGMHHCAAAASLPDPVNVPRGGNSAPAASKGFPVRRPPQLLRLSSHYTTPRSQLPGEKCPGRGAGSRRATVQSYVRTCNCDYF